jgi:tetratricopeptide (TPR) repeat protein
MRDIRGGLRCAPVAPVRSALLLTCVLALGAACTRRATWEDDVTPPEVYVDLLPSGAMLELDGKRLGPGSQSIQVRDRARTYKIKASAKGFGAIEVALPGEKLVGARIGIVLPPDGYGTARHLDFDDARSLAAAGGILLKSDRPGEALEYAERAVQVNPEHGPAYHVLGFAYRKLEKRKKSIDAWVRYLELEPKGPDAAAIRQEVERARGDLTIMPPKPPPGQ